MDELRDTLSMRRLIALLVCLPVSVIGILVAHQAGYALVATDTHTRADLLARTGHGYLDHLPVVVATMLVLVLGSLAGDVVATWRGCAEVSVRAWHFAAFAPVGFVIQEHVERILHDGAFPFDSWQQPTLWVGVALQLPVALFSWLCVTTLLRIAPRVQTVLALRGARPNRTRSGTGMLWARCEAVRAPSRLLATCAAGRAPPTSV